MTNNFISMDDFNYHLPDDKIASNPLQIRDSGRLLVYGESKIAEKLYRNIDEALPENTLIVFNNTSVIKARFHFDAGTKKPVEIFCIEPTATHDYSKALTAQSPVTWNCLVGNFKKRDWKIILKQNIATSKHKFDLSAKVIEKKDALFKVEFSWSNQLSFGEVLQIAGNVPLPPYIKRAPAADDEQRYQTIYAANKGSVAAPTAGLHFTENVFKKLRQKNIDIQFVTLHVSAGTFMPVKTGNALQHPMHNEWMEINKALIKKIADGNYSKLVAVGTTSLRTLESLFWLGAKAFNKVDLNTKTDAGAEMFLDQWEAYDENFQHVTMQQSMNALLRILEKENAEKLTASTRLMIVPGYNYKVADGLITNFHQPKSTLLLLVGAFIGNDWKKVYAHALENNFRFLSYGDGCLLWKNQAVTASSR